MIERTKQRFDLKPKRLAADTAYGTGKFLTFVVGAGIIPHLPVWDMSKRDDGTFPRSEFKFDSRRNVYICPSGKKLITTGHVTCLSAQAKLLPEHALTPDRARYQ
jgi:hypothetical protein